LQTLHSSQLAKDMQAVNSDREKEFLKLKNDHRMLCVSNALLTSDYELLKLRQSAITEVEGYTQCQQELSRRSKEARPENI
jgi:hypothetical protein